MTSTKAERRQERLRVEREQEKQTAITTPRHIHDDRWGYPGVGGLLLKLVRRPSFERTVCYEVRGEEGAPRLFRSVSEGPDEELVVGYARVAVPQIVLGRLLRSIDALSVPVRTRDLHMGVFDGVTYEVAAFGGVQAAARFSWRGGYAPEGWAALAELVESAIRSFDELDATPEGTVPL